MKVICSVVLLRTRLPSGSMTLEHTRRNFRRRFSLLHISRLDQRSFRQVRNFLIFFVEKIRKGGELPVIWELCESLPPKERVFQNLCRHFFCRFTEKTECLDKDCRKRPPTKLAYEVK